MREFRGVYLTAEDRKALGPDVESIDGVPIRDGKTSRLYGKSGASVNV